MYNKEKQLTTSFVFTYLRGDFNDQYYVHLASRQASLPYQYTCQIRKQDDKNFYSLMFRSTIWKNIFFFHILGIRQIQGYQHFRTVRSHHRGDKNNKGKNDHKFFMYGPQCEKHGGGRGVSIIRLGPSCFPAIIGPMSIYA